MRLEIELLEQIIKTQEDLSKKMDKLIVDAQKISYDLAVLKNDMGVDDR